MPGKLGAVVTMGQCTAGNDEASNNMLDACIAQLEYLEKESRKLVEVRRKDNLSTQNRLVKLIGNKPLFDCLLDNVSARVLWDTGSMISLLNLAWVKANFPEAIIQPISEFLDEKGEVRFIAANKTELVMVGCVVLNFSIGENSFPVPFLVTETELSQPIVGYNVIEHFIKTGNPDDVINRLVNSVRSVEAGKIQVMVNVVSQAIEDDDFLGNLRAIKACVIPPKGVARIRCRVKGNVKGLDLNFICSEPLVPDWDSDLIVSESLGELKRGRTPLVNIEVRNTSAKEKFIPKNMLVGEICAVNAVLPLKLFNESPVGSGLGEVNHVEAENGVGGSSPKWQPKADLDHLPEDQRKAIENLLYEECDVFARSDADIGNIPDFQMDIHLTDEVPVNQAYRHLPRNLYDDVKNYLNDLLVNGWIQQSSSPYSSPIVCVRKKDNSLRLCVDYRKLNLKTIPDRQPIPRIQDLLDGLYGQKIFSTLDMAKAYHQGYVRDICRKYTAFSTPWCMFEWLRVPFGLKNAPAAFQKYVNQALSGLLDRICLAYLDDILVFGRTFDEHLGNLRDVLRRLREKGVKLRVDKCVFAKLEVRYLGRLVSGDGYRADPEDVKALQKFREAPKTVGEVRSLLGFLGYYRGYVRDFAKKLKPVYDLLKIEQNVDTAAGKTGQVEKSGGGVSYDKKRKVVWTPELQLVVNDVIDTLQSPEVMAYPDFDAPFILNTDASGVGLGAVLYQKQGQEKLNRVISYASRTLTPAERNYHYHSGKLEFLALKWAVTEKFADYLGHGAKTTVYTDNNPLTYILTTAKLNATGMRWASDLADFDLELKYRPGKDNGDADGLSRNAVGNELETLERECSETCEKGLLTSVLAAPLQADCYGVSADLLQFPATQEDRMPMSKEQLMGAQIADDVVGPVYQSVVTGTRPNRRDWQSLASRSKVLFRQWKKLSIVEGVLVRNSLSCSQIVLPECLHHLVYIELHQKMGHLGLEKVMDLSRRRFFWPHMEADTDYFIKKQCTCIVSKKPNIPERAPLVPIQATYPFEIVAIDYLKVDRGKGGFEYILVVTDHFTKFAQAYPTKKKTGRSAADKIFNNFILQFGFPARLHHDLGREFNNQLFTQLHRLTGIRMSNTTPYHPEGDGQSERFNRTVINMLKCIPENEKMNWMAHLPKLMFAYNSTIHKSTQFSPFFLLFGREPRLPIDDVFPDMKMTGSSSPIRDRENIGTFVRTWNDRMNAAFVIANENIGKSAGFNKNNYDKKAKSVELVSGDRVLVKNVRPQGTTRAAKLASYWDNTVYEVVEQLKGIPVFVLREWNSRNKKTKTLHRNLLKRVNELAPVTGNESVVPASNDFHVSSPVLPGSAPVVQKSRTPRRQSATVVPHKGSKSKVSVGDSVQLGNKQVGSRHPVKRCSQITDSDSDSSSCDTVVVVTRRSRKLAGKVVPSGLPSLRGRSGSDNKDSDSGSGKDQIQIADPDVSQEHSVTISDASSEATLEEQVDEIDEVESQVSDEVGEVESQVSDEVGEVESQVSDEVGESENSSQQEESEYEEVTSEINESFHSAHSGISATDLDESLEKYPDVDEPPPRRSGRERRPPKKFEYDLLGDPFGKSSVRITRPKK